MSIASLSFTFLSANLPVSSPSADPAKAVAQAPAAPTSSPAANRASDSDGDRDGDRRSAGPTSRLSQAIMAALHAIGLDAPAAPATASGAGSTAAPTPPGTAPAPATTTTPATPPTTGGATPPATTTPAQNIASAVYQFAHELYAALRPAGRSEGAGQGHEHGGGEGRRHESHGDHGWKSQGYGDIAQRLDALAQRLTQAPSAPANGTANAAGANGGSTSVTVTVTLNDGAPTAATSDVATKTPAIPATPSAATGAVPTPASPASNDATKPLMDAFTKLFNALQPQGTAPTESDTTAKLSAFLKALAQSLSPAAANGGTQPMAAGSLVHITA
jgi:hypothetical protein